MARREKQHWPEGWSPVTGSTAALLTTQLLVELGSRSALAGRVEGVIGGWNGSDDVVVAMRDWQAPFAVAHLAWEKPDGRPWLVRLLQPRPQLAPALQPLDRIADLARWFD